MSNRIVVTVGSLGANQVQALNEADNPAADNPFITQSALDAAVIEAGDTNAEVVSARGGFPSLDARLDDIASETGVTDHGELTGLGDDDHPHYLTQARGDARYQTEAQVNQALALKADAAHTQAASTITDFAEAVDDRVSSLLVAGSGVTLSYNDAANSLTVTASGGAGGTGAPVMYVASDDAPARFKDMADYTASAGSAEDAINLAIGALPAAGGIVMLSPGTFTCDGPVLVNKDGVTLMGSGTGEPSTGTPSSDGRGTRIFAASGYTGSVLVLVQHSGNTRPASHCRVMDMTIDGNNRTGTAVTGLHFRSFCGLIQNVKTYRCSGHGMKVEGYSSWNTYDTKIVLCDSGFNGLDGIFLAPYATDLHILHTVMRYNAQDGLHLGSNTGGLQITGIHSYDNDRYGFHLESGGAVLKMVESKIENAGQHGVYFSTATGGAYDVTFGTCDFRRNGRLGSTNQYDQIRFQHTVGVGVGRCLITGSNFLADGRNNTAGNYKPGYHIKIEGSTGQDIRIANNTYDTGFHTARLDVWNGLRTVVNGMGITGSDPTSAGSWNGYAEDGLMLRRTDNSTWYKAYNGTWIVV